MTTPAWGVGGLWGWGHLPCGEPWLVIKWWLHVLILRKVLQTAGAP